MDQESKKGEAAKKLFELTVKAVILSEDGKVLILKRSDSDRTAPGKFDLPGGRIEDGEDIEDSLEREIKEELGIEVEIGPIINVFDFEKDYRKDKNISAYGKGLRFLAYHKGGKLKLSNEHKSFEWLEIDKAIEKLETEGFEKDKRDALIKVKEYLELKEALNGWKRCQADFENYRKRQDEMRSDHQKFVIESCAMEILPILDNFCISTEHIPEDQKKSPWVEGIMHIQRQLESVLQNFGIEEIKAKVGDEFDPNFHEAISGKGNKISKVVQKGYKIGERIIRATKVIVN